MKKFRLLPEPAKALGGVCAGIAYYIKEPVWVVRLLAFLLAVGTQFWFVYILMWIFIPEAEEVPEDYSNICE